MSCLRLYPKEIFKGHRKKTSAVIINKEVGYFLELEGGEVTKRVASV
jgi:hypothetical protein